MITGLWWKRKLDGADGYDTIPLQYGSQFTINSMGREWVGNYAFDIYKEIFTLIEDFISEDKATKGMWFLLGFTQVLKEKSNRPKKSDEGIFVEVPFYQTSYSIGSKQKKFLSYPISPRIVEPNGVMAQLCASQNSKYHQKFIEKWMLGEDEDEDDNEQ